MPTLFATSWDFQDLVNFHYYSMKFNHRLFTHACLFCLDAISRCCARDGQGSGPIHISNVECRGNELSLTDCMYTTDHNCHHNEDASVQCRTSNFI